MEWEYPSSRQSFIRTASSSFVPHAARRLTKPIPEQAAFSLFTSTVTLPLRPGKKRLPTSGRPINWGLYLKGKRFSARFYFILLMKVIALIRYTGAVWIERCELRKREE